MCPFDVTLSQSFSEGSASAQLSDRAARTGSTETWYRDVFIFLVPTWYRSTGSFDNTSVCIYIYIFFSSFFQIENSYLVLVSYHRLSSLKKHTICRLISLKIVNYYNFIWWRSWCTYTKRTWQSYDLIPSAWLAFFSKHSIILFNNTLNISIDMWCVFWKEHNVCGHTPRS